MPRARKVKTGSFTCFERLIIREPYKKLGFCLNTFKKVFGEVYPNPDFLNDLLENEAHNAKRGDWQSGYVERVPEECEGLTVEECILKTGEFEYKEWAFDEEYSYKTGIEVDCNEGKIYVYYCETE